MPIPRPRKGEKEDKYISRCIKFQYDEGSKKPAAQIKKICYVTYRRFHK